MRFRSPGDGDSDRPYPHDSLPLSCVSSGLHRRMEQGYLKAGTQDAELQPPDALGERAKELEEGSRCLLSEASQGGAKWDGGSQTQAKA